MLVLMHIKLLGEEYLLSDGAWLPRGEKKHKERQQSSHEMTQTHIDTTEMCSRPSTQFKYYVLDIYPSLDGARVAQWVR